MRIFGTRFISGVGLSLVVVVGGTVALVAQDNSRSKSSSGKPNEAAVAQTRDTVKMLDDVYKTAVVLITEKYVESEQDFPAGSAAVALFSAIGQKGWHTAELLDVTGEPYDDKNVANDTFEKQAVEKIKQGQAFVEAIEQTADGTYVLRAMTPIPVVMKKCVMCHAHYEKVPAGEAIGAISYCVPIRNN